MVVVQYLARPQTRSKTQRLLPRPRCLDQICLVPLHPLRHPSKGFSALKPLLPPKSLRHHLPSRTPLLSQFNLWMGLAPLLLASLSSRLQYSQAVAEEVGEESLSKDLTFSRASQNLRLRSLPNHRPYGIRLAHQIQTLQAYPLP